MTAAARLPLTMLTAATRLPLTAAAKLPFTAATRLPLTAATRLPFTAAARLPLTAATRLPLDCYDEATPDCCEAFLLICQVVCLYGCNMYGGFSGKKVSSPRDFLFIAANRWIANLFNANFVRKILIPHEYIISTSYVLGEYVTREIRKAY